MNNFGPNWQSSNTWGNGYQAPFNTNIIYVTSPEEALMRTTQRNCEAVYFHQDQPIFYRVRVDLEGRKFWQAVRYNVDANVQDPNVPASKADMLEILTRLSRLEERLIPKSEVIVNEQPNGQNTVQ